MPSILSKNPVANASRPFRRILDAFEAIRMHATGCAALRSRMMMPCSRRISLAMPLLSDSFMMRLMPWSMLENNVSSFISSLESGDSQSRENRDTPPSSSKTVRR